MAITTLVQTGYYYALVVILALGIALILCISRFPPK